jgi:hypothetical protein
MGREVRMVPPNWEHPITEDNYRRMRKQPMFDETFADAKKRWMDGLLEWEAGNKSESEDCEYWDWEGAPPDRAYYRPWQDEEATWFQLWETVSEGTPVSPPFETREELIVYLAEYGDEWDQQRKPGKSGWGMESATRFVGVGWAPSMVVTDGVVVDGKFAV